MMNRPEIVKDEHLEYLDNLRESDTTNMFGSYSYLQNEFPGVSKVDAIDIVNYWIQTFGQEDR